MAQFYLLNCTQVGNTSKRYAGELIDDALESTTPLVAAGAQLFPAADAGVAVVVAAAAIAQAQRGLARPEAILDGIMLGAAAIAALT